MNNKIIFIPSFFLLNALLAYTPLAHAAKAIDLSQQPLSILHTFSASPAALAGGGVKLEEVQRSVDFNQTLHVRVQETYQGYPVWGGDAVVHIPHGVKTNKSFAAVAVAAKEKNGSMNGTVYQDLHSDLANAPASIFTQEQAQKAMQQAISAYQQTVGGSAVIKDEHSKLMVYLDKNKKAHWAYEVYFYAAATKANGIPAKPFYILDAVTLKVHKQWNDIKTIDNVVGGGWGGNVKMGKLAYDGQLTDDKSIKHLPTLNMQRDANTRTCYWQNKDVVVKRYPDQIMSFNCKKLDDKHGSIYWNGESDAVRGAYSPANDALYAGNLIKDMYQSWYQIPVLANPDGSPMVLSMVVHVPYLDNAYWDDVNMQMIFGDGDYVFYPLTALDVSAHEIAHGFTDQHAKLIYTEQSGGMNEAFSDMASQAIEFYVTGKNTWKIGADIYKLDDLAALRFIDQPGQDCKASGNPKPGYNCSIDNANQYIENTDMNVHFTSGVYNRAFYLLSSTPGWDVRKAFDVMVQANRYYWTANSTFAQGLCGVVKAAKDYSYNEKEVVQAFSKVGVQAQC